MSNEDFEEYITIATSGTNIGARLIKSEKALDVSHNVQTGTKCTQRCTELEQRNSELLDKLYHESRKAPEVEYLLNHKIEELEGIIEDKTKRISKLEDENNKLLKEIFTLEDDLLARKELIEQMQMETERLEHALAVAIQGFQLILTPPRDIDEPRSAEFYKSFWERDKRDARYALDEIKSLKGDK